MGANGGFRPNSGRKPKAEKYIGPIAAAEDRIADRLPDLIDWAFELAKGVTVQEETRDGGQKVYTKPPDYRAIEYLVNRVMGKPTERVEHTGEDGEPIRHAINLNRLSVRELDELDRLVSRLAIEGPSGVEGGDQGGEVPPIAV